MNKKFVIKGDINVLSKPKILDIMQNLLPSMLIELSKVNFKEDKRYIIVSSIPELLRYGYKLKLIENKSTNILTIIFFN